MPPSPRTLSRPIRNALFLAGTLVMLSCADPGPEAPAAGEIVLALESEVSTIGALQFLIQLPSGVAVPELRASGHVIHHRQVPEGLRVIIIGELKAGEVVRFSIPNRLQAQSYSITNEAAADGTTFQLIPTSAYSLSKRVQ